MTHAWRVPDSAGELPGESASTCGSRNASMIVNGHGSDGALLVGPLVGVSDRLGRIEGRVSVDQGDVVVGEPVQPPLVLVGGDEILLERDAIIVYVSKSLMLN